MEARPSEQCTCDWRGGPRAGRVHRTGVARAWRTVCACVRAPVLKQHVFEGIPIYTARERALLKSSSYSA